MCLVSLFILSLSPLTKGCIGLRTLLMWVWDFSSVPPCHSSYLGSSYIDADPEQQEEDSKAHEE